MLRTSCGLHLTLQDRQIDADPAGGLARVEVEQALVFDARDQGRHRLDGTHLAGAVLGVELAYGYVDHEVVQRPGVDHEGAQGVVAALDAQVAGVEVVVCHGHEGLCLERGIKAEGV